MAKKIEFDLEARDGIKRGVDALANAVKVTLGPKGRNVIIGSKSFIAEIFLSYNKICGDSRSASIFSESVTK